MRKLLISLLSVCCLVIALGAAAPVFAEDTAEVADANALKTAVSTGGSFILTDDIVLDTHLEIGTGIEVTLDLNGKTISADTSGTAANGGVFLVNEGAVLSLRNGSITGGDASENGGGIYNAGTVNLEEVTISGNKATAAGGGIYNDGDLAIKGLITVADNVCTGTGTIPENVYLPEGKVIRITGVIDSRSRVGIRSAKDSAQVTSGYGDFSNIRDGEEIFLPDMKTMSSYSSYSDDMTSYEVYLSVPVSYLRRSYDPDENQTVSRVRTQSKYQIVSADDTVWKDGWYYVSRNTTLNQRVEIRGDARLIVADGATLTAKKGLFPNAEYDASLTIFSQEGETGKIIATGENSAGIGSVDQNNYSGYITIHGCTIEATGSKDCAGIGAGKESGYQNIEIYGGTITASGGERAAGIGCGRTSKYKGRITIYGGTVTAQGGGNGAGIGGGSDNNGPEVTIYSGTVKATAGQEKLSGVSSLLRNGAAGIGGGYSGNGGTVNIYGGNTEAIGGVEGAGIGGGGVRIRGGSGSPRHLVGGGGGTLNVYGGKVVARGGRNDAGNTGGAGIGCGNDSDKTGGTVNVYGGTVEAYSGRDACGIGGAKEVSSGANVTITGGTVIASARSDEIGVAIGFVTEEYNRANYAHNPGTLDIRTGFHVLAGSNEGSTAIVTDSTKRVSACQGQKYVRIEACDHESPDNDTYTIIDETRHSRLCSACGTAIEEEHSYDSEGICVCGDGHDVTKHTVTIDLYPDLDTDNSTMKIADGRKYVLPEPKQNEWLNYTFTGWNIEGGDFDETKAYQPGHVIESMKDDLYITAVWNESKTISFDPGEAGSGSKDDVLAPESTIYRVPDENGFVPPDGKEFIGWYVKVDDTFIMDESSGSVEPQPKLFLPGDGFEVTGDAVLEAQWDIGWSVLRNYLADAPDGTFYQLQTDMSDSKNAGPLVIASGKNITIDLNGHTLDAKKSDGTYEYAFLVNGSLTIMDSSENGDGRITGASGTAVMLRSGTEEAPASFTMDGGTIADNGGGIDVRSGNGIITLNKGKITGCKNSEAIYINSGSSFTMNGGSITGNDTTAAKAPVFIYNGSFTMNGGSITENVGEDVGGVYLEHGRFTMNGGAITGNASKDSLPSAGGVFVGQPTGNPKTTPVFTVSGDAQITDNRAIKTDPSDESVVVSETMSNVLLDCTQSNDQSVIYIGEKGLSKDALIGVTTGSEPATGSPVTFTSGLDGKGAVTNFRSDQKRYITLKTDPDQEAALAIGAVISFAAGEGEGSMEPESVGLGSQYPLPKPDFTEPEGKDFIGWQVGDDAEATLKQPDETIPVDGDVTLLARYDAHTHNPAPAEKRSATCTEDGISESCWKCQVCGKYFSDAEGTAEITDLSSLIIPATGHDWEEPEYTWSEDYSTVTAVLTCKNDRSLNHGIMETVDTTHKVDSDSCEKKDVYTAKFKNDAFGTQTKEVLIEASHKNLEHIAAKAATEQNAGNYEYWHCADCGRYFKDKDATQEFGENEWLIPAVQKMSQTLTVKAKKVKVKSKKVKKKAQTVKPLTVKGQKTTLTYKGKPVGKKARKALKINKKTGKITVRKKTKKGTYKMKVTVTAAGNATYKSASKTVTVTIKVR